MLNNKQTYKFSCPHPFASEITDAVNQLVSLINPSYIFLFGSCAGSCVKPNSETL